MNINFNYLSTLVASPPIPRSIRLKDDTKLDDSSSSFSPAKKRAMSPAPHPSAALLHQLNNTATTSTSDKLSDVTGNHNNNHMCGSNKSPNHGEGPGRRKRKGELDKLLEDKKVRG